VVQPIATTKLIILLRGGTCLEIIPLLVHIFIIHVQVTTTITKHVKNNDKSIKEQVEPIDLSFSIILDSGTGPFEFLYATLPLTPH
jgi:hypothetical protein